MQITIKGVIYDPNTKLSSKAKTRIKPKEFSKYGQGQCAVQVSQTSSTVSGEAKSLSKQHVWGNPAPKQKDPGKMNKQPVRPDQPED